MLLRIELCNCAVLKNVSFIFTVTCNSPKDQLLDITWVLRRSPCAQEYMGLNRVSTTNYV